MAEIYSTLTPMLIAYNNGITTAERNAITGQLPSTTIYNTDTNEIEIWDGTQWNGLRKSGVDNPMTSDLDANGFSILNANNIDLSGVLTVGTGSEAAPAIVPSGDSNTGLLFPAADTVAFSTAGTERMRIKPDGEGRVVIGGDHTFSADGISTESSASGTSSQMQYRLKDNAGGFAYIGRSQPQFSGGLELDGGASYFAGTAGNVLITAQGASDSVKILTGGFASSNERLEISSTGAIGLAGANYGTAGQVLTSQGSAASPTWSTPSTAPTPAGAIMSYAGTVAPSGWLISDGTGYDPATYPDLFAVIGYDFGGSGSTFNLPDLTQRVPMGVGGSYARLNTGGSATHTLTTAQMPSHNHGVNDSGHFHSAVSVAGSGGGPGVASWTVGGASVANGGTFGTTGIQATGISIQNNGSGQAFNILQPYLVLYYIIKT